MPSKHVGVKVGKADRYTDEHAVHVRDKSVGKIEKHKSGYRAWSAGDQYQGTHKSVRRAADHLSLKSKRPSELDKSLWIPMRRNVAKAFRRSTHQGILKK